MNRFIRFSAGRAFQAVEVSGRKSLPYDNPMIYSLSHRADLARQDLGFDLKRPRFRSDDNAAIP
jgi:hypothetical protein